MDDHACTKLMRPRALCTQPSPQTSQRPHNGPLLSIPCRGQERDHDTACTSPGPPGPHRASGRLQRPQPQDGSRRGGWSLHYPAPAHSVAVVPMWCVHIYTRQSGGWNAFVSQRCNGLYTIVRGGHTNHSCVNGLALCLTTHVRSFPHVS